MKPSTQPRLPGLFRGHEASPIWQRLHALVFGEPEPASKPKAKRPPVPDPAIRRAMIESAAHLLEAERREALPGLPVAATDNLVRDERRTAGTWTPVHPVHDVRFYGWNQRRLWIPWAEDAPGGARRGTYPRKHPAGLVIHWTAGHRNGLKAGNEFMRASGRLYLLVDKNGNLSQSAPLDQWGYHAGVSSWATASGTVSDEFAGVEVQAWGMLTKTASGFRSWSGHAVPAEEVRHVPRKVGNIQAGHWHIFTRAQMHTLRRLSVWLALNNPEVFDTSAIVGHDEVSPGRKTDPGGALWDHDADQPIPMERFREMVEADVDAVKALFVAARKK